MTELLAPDIEHPIATVTTDSAEGLNVESLSPGRLAVRRYRKHKGAMVSTVLLAIIVVWVLLSPITARYGVNKAVFKTSAGHPNVYLSPRSVAWFGTDSIGRDIYSRLIYGLRTSLVIGLASAIFSALVGVIVGSIAGFRGGWFDDVLMRVTDLFLAFPFLVALLVVRMFLGHVKFLTDGPPGLHFLSIGKITSVRFIVVLFVLFGWMGVARLVRGQVLSLKEREFIEASRAVGASNFRIISRHLLPNSIGPILVALTAAVVAAIVGESTLSFFGFGPQPGGGTSLGLLVADAKGAVQSGYWWLAVFPCVALVLVTMCINFIGDGLRDATDPKLQHGGK